MGFSKRFFHLLKGLFSGERELLQGVSSRNLSYLGDSLLDLFLRHYLVEKYPRLETTKLHRLSVQYTNPNSQGKIIEMIYGDLLPLEKKVVEQSKRDFKRIPSPIHSMDFQSSSALESLLGYLFLEGDYQRLMEILMRIIEETKFYEMGSP